MIYDLRFQIYETFESGALQLNLDLFNSDFLLQLSDIFSLYPVNSVLPTATCLLPIAMQPTFLLRILPPPATGAGIFS